MSNSFATVFLANLAELMPATMRFDYIRIYQDPGSESVTCDPDGYPTTSYIRNHPEPCEFTCDSSFMMQLLTVNRFKSKLNTLEQYEVRLANQQPCWWLYSRFFLIWSCFPRNSSTCIHRIYQSIIREAVRISCAKGYRTGGIGANSHFIIEERGLNHCIAESAFNLHTTLFSCYSVLFLSTTGGSQHLGGSRSCILRSNRHMCFCTNTIATASAITLFFFCPFYCWVGYVTEPGWFRLRFGRSRWVRQHGRPILWW